MKHFVTLAALLTSLVALAQTPQLPFNPDENGDGLIGVADLQSFLALYNTEFSAAVSNNGIAFINLGDNLNKLECHTSCNDLPGRWGVPSYMQITSNWQLFADAIDWTYDSGGSANDSPSFWIQANSAEEIHQGGTYDLARLDDAASSGFSLIPGTYFYDNSGLMCVCSITERPKIEYQRIVQDGSGPTMNTIVNELLNEGWYILSTDELYMHLWRWKD